MRSNERLRGTNWEKDPFSGQLQAAIMCGMDVFTRNPDQNQSILSSVSSEIRIYSNWKMAISQVDSVPTVLFPNPSTAFAGCVWKAKKHRLLSLLGLHRVAEAQKNAVYRNLLLILLYFPFIQVQQHLSTMNWTLISWVLFSWGQLLSSIYIIGSY